jgi:hypothetical protein
MIALIGAKHVQHLRYQSRRNRISWRRYRFRSFGDPYRKNLITLADARTILDLAALAISGHGDTPAGKEAIQTIAILKIGRFSEDGHNK